MELEEISDKIRNCKRCPLSKTRTNPVFGAGSTDAKIMFIGEAPGRNEDLRGEPFVGAAGKILDELLGSISITRDDVYIANILKCRPPKNRNPRREEIEICTEYLDDQIEILNPVAIATLGNFASNYLLNKFGIAPESIGNIHGKVFHVSDFQTNFDIVALYHPAVAVYNYSKMDTLTSDFKILSQFLVR
ncbi:MAG: uracil-DNA glycosylase [Halobacteriota archaeon]|nr:uracil-DNA glycosylase [Halobacteriota archaeon]